MTTETHTTPQGEEIVTWTDKDGNPVPKDKAVKAHLVILDKDGHVTESSYVNLTAPD